MNAIELLETQHRDVDTLFERLKHAQGDARNSEFDDLADLLAIHASIEEVHFYPSVKAQDTEDILHHSLEDHLAIKRKLALCMAARLGGRDFGELLRSLAEEVDRHVAEERSELFPIVQRILDAEQLEALGQEMTSTMAQLQQGRPRFDVPLQTLAPMPLTDPPPAQGSIGSELFPRIARLLALPMQALGFVREVRGWADGFVRGLRRGLGKQRGQHA